MSCYYHSGWYNCLVITVDHYILNNGCSSKLPKSKIYYNYVVLGLYSEEKCKMVWTNIFFMKMSSLHATGFQFSSYVKDIDESLIYINLLLCTQVVFSTEICCLIQTCCTQVVSFKKCPVTCAHIWLAIQNFIFTILPWLMHRSWSYMVAL